LIRIEITLYLNFISYSDSSLLEKNKAPERQLNFAVFGGAEA